MNTYCPYCMSLTSRGQFCPKCGKNLKEYSPSSHHFPPGQLLNNRYVVGKTLGEGGFGITYLGLDITLERIVAIKEYFPTAFVYRESSTSLGVTCYAGTKQILYEKGRDQFLQEARVMARLDKLPEIVQVLDFFPANNTAYLVMEYLEGTNLRFMLSKQGRIPAKHLFQMMEPVLQAMNTMHSAGIIHRDISPDNMLLMADGKIKLLDFGCARDVDTEHSMTVMLKHGYAPIEQYTGYNQGPWTDVYALSATMYHCLTGKTPPPALERMNNQNLLIPPNKLGAALTPDQEQALLKGLAVEPKNRWQSLASLYNALYNTVIKGFPWVADERNTELIDPSDSHTNINNSLTDASVPEKLEAKTDQTGASEVPHSHNRNRSNWMGIIAIASVVATIVLVTVFRRSSAMPRDAQKQSGDKQESIMYSESVSDVKPSETELVEPTGVENPGISEYFGTISDGIYTNERLGIGCHLNDDWVYYSDEEIRESKQTALEILSDPDIAVLDSDDLDAFDFIDMVAESSTNLANVNVEVHHLTKIQAHVLTEELIASTRLENTEFEKMEIRVDVAKTETRNILGGEHSVIHIEGSIGDLMIYITEVVIMADHDWGTITVTSYIEDSTDDVLEQFFKID